FIGSLMAECRPSRPKSPTAQVRESTLVCRSCRPPADKRPTPVPATGPPLWMACRIFSDSWVQPSNRLCFMNLAVILAIAVTGAVLVMADSSNTRGPRTGLQGEVDHALME